MQLISGTRLARYEIRSQIGAGGMGEVYLAQDSRLDRKVALKILPPDVANNQDRMRRFEQEAKSAAALNHPNIAHIYEIGASDGVRFIALEALMVHEARRSQPEIDAGCFAWLIDRQLDRQPNYFGTYVNQK